MFNDRIEAGLTLAQKLTKYENCNGIVMAIPRGGVPVGFIIALKLNLPLEVILSKKIGHPFNKEFAVGSVSLNSSFVNSEFNIPQEYIQEETNKIRELLKQRYVLYMGDKKPTDLKNKIVIIVDDGIATGNTLLATIELVRNNSPQKIIAAIPILPYDSVQKIKDKVNELIYINAPRTFYAVGQFYRNFNQVSDEEAIKLLQEANNSFSSNKSNINKNIKL